MSKSNRIVRTLKPFAAAALLAAFAGLALPANASSHAEAPFVKELPKVDATDFYMFNSYEPGREDFVTIVANYYPLQDPYGGPNYFMMDPDAIYQIHIDNNGDAREDITFTFRFQNTNQDVSLNIGGVLVPIPLINAGAIGPRSGDNAALNVRESYTCSVTYGPRDTGVTSDVIHGKTGAKSFRKPVDYIGEKSIPNYEAYAADHIFPIAFADARFRGKMFVGQRKDSFVVNLGETFDLVNLNPLGPETGKRDSLDDKNVTSFILELPKKFLSPGGRGIIGGWTSASMRRHRTLLNSPTFSKPSVETGDFVQVSRLSMPLVNELVIGLRDKDKFNASEPRNDGQFLTYVTNPTLPALLQILFGVTPPSLPRNDLVSVFLTGVEGLNKPANVTPGEMMRLNLNTNPNAGGIPISRRGSQSRLGVIGGDLQGYPNGRRPGDDVVDISLRVVMGRLYPDAGVPGGNAPSGALLYTDGASVSDQNFDNVFPYLRTPIPGSPNR